MPIYIMYNLQQYQARKCHKKRRK